jgi:hypothetical protein
MLHACFVQRISMCCVCSLMQQPCAVYRCAAYPLLFDRVVLGASGLVKLLLNQRGQGVGDKNGLDKISTASIWCSLQQALGGGCSTIASLGCHAGWVAALYCVGCTCIVWEALYCNNSPSNS